MTKLIEYLTPFLETFAEEYRPDLKTQVFTEDEQKMRADQE
jgi:hypothetical protein